MNEKLNQLKEYLLSQGSMANGENVSPEELEEKLYQTEGILDAAVYEKDGRITAELFVDRTLIPDLSAAYCGDSGRIILPRV